MAQANSPAGGHAVDPARLAPLLSATLADLPAVLLDVCRSIGFAQAGLCEAKATAFGDELDRWLADGQQGSMGWLADHLDARKDPRRLLRGATSMLVVADQYADGTPDQPAADGGRARGRIARYARGRDYHRSIKRRLHALCDTLRLRFPDQQFRAFSDIEPVLEREHAARAGLGWVGKHTLVIHPVSGSYILLGGIVSTLRLDPPAAPRVVADRCGTCTRCIDACPTQAITPYRVNASRCISYLTIEHRGPIDPAMQPAMGDWLFGCDICQEVCPHNQPASRRPREAHEAYAPARDSLDLLEVLGWTPEQRGRELSGTAIKRARLDMLKRNALILAGNRLSQPGAEGLAGLRARIAAIAADAGEPALVRETAGQVLARLASLGR
jgi:epoxyqueuosine reductase